MELIVRGERAGDELDIDTVNCRAFGSMGEANLVRELRACYPAFDRRFSLTAWDGDQCVGHTLFTPARIRLMDSTVPALAVGPVAVVPDYQRQGIGGQMVHRGHELGAREGFALAFLMGHSSYYSRHGYHSCFGFGKMEIDLSKLPSPEVPLEPWPVSPADLPWLVERLTRELDAVDFGWLWGSTLNEWTRPGVNALVWRTGDGTRAAYSLAGVGGARNLHMLLAEDVELARAAIATIKPPEIAVHPSGWLAQNAMDPEWGTASATPSIAAMVCELQDDVLQPYLEALGAGERLPGTANWPLPYLMVG